MDDDQKWLEAAAAIEQDIYYLRKALCACDKRGGATSLQQDIKQLKIVLSVYKNNAASGASWPSPDDLYCIETIPCVPHQVATATRRSFKTAV